MVCGTSPPGDFNGDNQVDFGLRNPAHGVCYIRFGPVFGSQITYQWAPAEPSEEKVMQAESSTRGSAAGSRTGLD